MEEMLTIMFTGKIKPVKPINEQLTLCKCYVMALGGNTNRTIFGKEATDDALPSLYNIPVVGHLYRDEDGNLRMGGHDMALEKNEDGTYKFKPKTVPYGVVPEKNDVHYEEVEESNGEKRTYLVANIILWTGRYPELLEAIYNEDIYFSQSMEIVPFEVEKTKTGLNIIKYQYSALCLLGKSDDSKNVKPCFKSSRVEPYKFSEEENWATLFSEFKEQLAQSYSAADVGKGGKKTLNETIKKILIEFGLAEDTVLSFEVAEDMSEEELRTKIQEVYCAGGQSGEGSEGNSGDASTGGEGSNGGANGGENNSANDGAGEGDGNGTGENAQTGAEGDPAPADGDPAQTYSASSEPIKFSVDLTYEEKRSLLRKALNVYEVHNENSYIWYCLIDFNDTFVYASYHFAGKDIPEQSGNMRIPYVINEDVPVLDIQNTEKVRLVWLTKEEEEKLTAEKTQLAELVKFKADKLEEEKRLTYSAVVAEFADLGEIDEYKTVVKEVLAFESAEALREKLYAIRGKNADKVGKKPLNTIRIPVGFQEKTKQDEYAEFMAKYLPAKK